MVGASFFIWADDPDYTDFLEHWHRSSTIRSIAKLPTLQMRCSRHLRTLELEFSRWTPGKATSRWSVPSWSSLSGKRWRRPPAVAIMRSVAGGATLAEKLNATLAALGKYVDETTVCGGDWTKRWKAPSTSAAWTVAGQSARSPRKPASPCPRARSVAPRRDTEPSTTSRCHRLGRQFRPSRRRTGRWPQTVRPRRVRHLSRSLTPQPLPRTRASRKSWSDAPKRHSLSLPPGSRHRPWAGQQEAATGARWRSWSPHPGPGGDRMWTPRAAASAGRATRLLPRCSM